MLLLLVMFSCKGEVQGSCRGTDIEILYGKKLPINGTTPHRQTEHGDDGRFAVEDAVNVISRL